MLVYLKHGSVTHFTWANMMPTWNLDTVNFWSQIAFAFTGLELVVLDERRSARSAAHVAARGVWRRRDDRVHVHRWNVRDSVAGFGGGSGSEERCVSGHQRWVPECLKVAFVGVLAAVLVTVGNAGGVGSTVAGIARVPFVVGIDRYLPKAFGKIHPKWKTPHISIMVQAGVSGD